MRFTVIALLVALLFPFTKSPGCNVVELVAGVVFNTLDGYVRQKGEVWSGATVALYPGWNYVRGQRAGFVKEVVADENGHFDFKKVDSGRYTVVLLDRGEFRSAYSILVLHDSRPLSSTVAVDYQDISPDCKHMPRWYLMTHVPNSFALR